MPDRVDENAIERQRVECVFALGGGELHRADERFPDPWDGLILYWYEGAPSYAADDLRAAARLTCPICGGTGAVADDDRCDECEGRGQAAAELRTAILCCLYGMPEPPPGWEQVASYSSSGEGQCWCEGDSDCHACEGDGVVYLGDGWREVVYRRLPLSSG